MTRDLSLLTSKEIVDAFNSCNGVIIPVASLEQCGLHAATGVDIKVADYISPILADKLDMLVSPTIAYGDTLEMADYPGTVNIPTDVLSNFYYSVASSFLASGAKCVLFFVSHSLNMRAVDNTCRKLYSEGKKAIAVDFWKACSQVSKGILSDSEYGTGHGAEQITSVSLAINPMLIKKEKAVNEEPLPSFGTRVKHIYGSSNVCTAYSNFHDYSTTGSWGDVSKASEEKGKRIIEEAISLIVREVFEVRTLHN